MSESVRFAPSDPEYIRAVVGIKPQEDDPKETAIVDKIRGEVNKSGWGPGAIDEISNEQVAYLHEVLAAVSSGNDSLVRERTQGMLGTVAEKLRSEIVQGAEYISQIPKGRGALLMTNHLGLYKLAGINPREELKTNIPGYDFMYPFPLYFGGLKPVSDVLGDSLSYVSNEFPAQFGVLHKMSGFVHIPPAAMVSSNRMQLLLEQTGDALRVNPSTAMVNFPEGGTSGKYIGLSPYDLDPFKTGGYVIASLLGIPAIMVGQYFDAQRGLQLAVFPPREIPTSTERQDFERIASDDQAMMQAWLDQKRF